ARRGDTRLKEVTGPMTAPRVRALRRITGIMFATAALAATAGPALAVTGDETRLRNTAFPSALQFKSAFVATTTTYARQHGDRKRIRHADCVQGDPGSYMCS